MNSSLSTKCPICSEIRTLKKFGSFELEVCNICGLHSKPSHQYLGCEAEKKRYLFHSIHPDLKYEEQMVQFLHSAILPYAKQGEALDYGCGQIRTLEKLLNKAGFITSGYDRYFCNDSSRLEKKYDVVTATEVVEHFQDLTLEWETLIGLVKPGGLLAISTQFIVEDLENWWYLRDSTHYHFYDRKTFEALGMKYRLEILFMDSQHIVVFKKGRF